MQKQHHIESFLHRAYRKVNGFDKNIKDTNNIYPMHLENLIHTPHGHANDLAVLAKTQYVQA
jgi:hypothetical protein